MERDNIFWDVAYALLVIVASALLVLVFAVASAEAAIDLGDGACQETSTGEQGLWNGTTADDDGCVTQAEYEAMYPLTDTEIAAGVSTPLDRQVTVSVELEPKAPTVKEYWEDPFVRAERAGLTIE